MKTWEKLAVGAGIVVVLYMVMQNDKDDKKYEYRRTVTGKNDWKDWQRGGSQRFGS